MGLLKPEHNLRRHKLRSTIVVFGRARLLSPSQAREKLIALENRTRIQLDDQAVEADIRRARRQLENSRYYEEARRFGEIVSRRFQQEDHRDFVGVTGGGSGIMEAANRGAFDADARSIGFNITLPSEREPNSFISPDLCFQFRYFGPGNILFLLRCRALVAFPGGYGTLDELFEALTLMQTGKVGHTPIVLVGESFWRRAINFEFLLDGGMVDRQDIDLLEPTIRVDDEMNFKVGSKTFELTYLGPGHGNDLVAKVARHDNVAFVVDAVSPRRLF